MLVDFPNFSSWLDQYCLSLDMAAQIFGVSRRTVSRWRATAQISASAAQLARTIERQAPPWNGQFRRSLYYGLIGLTYEWREQHAQAQGFPTWQDWMRSSTAGNGERIRSEGFS